MFQGFVDQLMALAEALDTSASIDRCIYLHLPLRHLVPYYPGGLVAPMCIHLTSLKTDMLRDRV